MEGKSNYFNLEDRTFKFAQDVRNFLKNINKSISNFEDAKQLVRSSGSVGANYIEANESFSKKDFVHRVKISRKEAKESRYWLLLLDLSNDNLDKQRKVLVNEVTELMKIFGAIIEKSK